MLRSERELSPCKVACSAAIGRVVAERSGFLAEPQPPSVEPFQTVKRIRP